MGKESLVELLSKIKNDKQQNILKAYFVRKPSASKMHSYQPQISAEVQADIIATVFPYIENQLEKATIVAYNPVGVADGEIESLRIESINQIKIFNKSITDEEVFKDLSSLQISSINFYCFVIEYEGKKLWLFRQFAKMKKLRSGYLAQFFNDELIAMDGNFLGIDETTDMLLFEDEVIIFNHISLERIFNYRDQYLSKTNEAMGEILRQGIVTNLEQFTEDCCRDVRIMKRFTNIMTQGRLPLFFENYEKVPEIVKELELDIDFDDEGKLIYREKSQLYHIVNLMSDSYFRSLLAERIGIAKIEEAFE